MEATLGISVYSCFSLNQQNAIIIIISYVFSSTKSENKRVEQVLPGRWGGWGKQCTHMSKCKNEKKKKNDNTPGRKIK
jgi:hypothetical protein